MVATQNSPLDSFPPAATGKLLNAKVAQESLGGNKRKRDTGGLDIPEDLMEVFVQDSELILFRPTVAQEVSRIVKWAGGVRKTVSVLNSKVTATHGCSRSGDIVIELSNPAFKTVDVNKEQMTVRVGGGVTSRLVDTVLSHEGLITPLVGYTVGLGAFLSGGFGFASRLHGLTVDNILEIELVLANGKIVSANKHEYADLFWALRGCGTSFGVVTSITLRCFPLVRSLSANLIFPFEADTGADLMRHWRDCLNDAPEELYSNFVIAAGPHAPSGTVAILQVCHLGAHDIGMSFIQRMASFSGVKYHFKDCDEISYLRQQELVEAVLKGAAVNKTQQPESQVKYLLDGDVLSDLPDEVIDDTCRSFHEEAKAGSIWCIELFAGKQTEFIDSCIPLRHRQGKFHAASIMRVPIDDPATWENDVAGRDWIRTIISKVSPGGPLPSFLPSYRDDPREAKHYHDMIRGCYGHENWSRLKSIKVSFDPMNCFNNGFDAGMLGAEEQLIDGT